MSQKKFCQHALIANLSEDNHTHKSAFWIKENKNKVDFGFQISEKNEILERKVKNPYFLVKTSH